MDQRVTRVQPDVPSRGSQGLSSTLPPDLLEQVRGRLGLLALLMMVAFALDPLLYFGGWAAITLNEGAPSDYFRDLGFYWGDLSIVATSAILWRVARSRRVSTPTLQLLGLLYQVLICFVIALRTFWEYYRDTGILPNLTWAPAVVILFPLVLPAAPRVMLAGAITATEREVRIDAKGGHIERVTSDLANDPRIGLLAIDFETRRRMRINGNARIADGIIVVTPHEVYANCPQYIGIGDTFFIATGHPTAGADISHRGGPPGFVHEDGDVISWPDYSGNNMFNTLGNLEVDPRCGLLFVDFETGAMRQVHGRARVEWNVSERTVIVNTSKPIAKS